MLVLVDLVEIVLSSSVVPIVLPVAIVLRVVDARIRVDSSGNEINDSILHEGSQKPHSSCKKNKVSARAISIWHRKIHSPINNPHNPRPMQRRPMNAQNTPRPNPVNMNPNIFLCAIKIRKRCVAELTNHSLCCGFSPSTSSHELIDEDHDGETSATLYVRDQRKCGLLDILTSHTGTERLACGSSLQTSP